MGRVPELSPRLAAAASLVPEGARLADIGTDHAYLPVNLLLTGRVKSAVAADLREGPLSRARSTAREYGCEEKMVFRLCNGLSGVGPEEADTVVIAGMGGETIAEILSEATWVKGKGLTLVLQPMSRQPYLRRWLWQNGFAIREEKLACEGKMLYTIISASAGASRPMTPAQEWAGVQSPGMEAPLRGRYLEHLCRKAARALEGMSRSRGTKDIGRLQEMEAVCQGLNEMREEWQRWQR